MVQIAYAPLEATAVGVREALPVVHDSRLDSSQDSAYNEGVAALALLHSSTFCTATYVCAVARVIGLVWAGRLS